ncbi:MAG: pyruvate kinase [Clostridia bacterium]|nr:pyruvate kinase [Clostridia bacterium]
MLKTKIVCTLGPASNSPEMIEKMIRAGMNVARLNFSHGTHEEHAEVINRIKKARDRLGVPLAIMLDTKGPEIRLGKFKGGEAELKDGERITLRTDDPDFEGTASEVYITYAGLPAEISPGTRILLNDGAIELTAEKLFPEEGKIEALVTSGGLIKSGKGVNVPNVHLDMPHLSDRDKADLIFGIEHDVDFVAASFVRSKADVIGMRKFLDYHGGHGIKIISKIENLEGVDNFAEILERSDGIMVARGDMGVEVAFERLPGLQKRFIKECYQSGKMVITATQMLESMIEKPTPTRAEISDVANAVFDGTSAVMLSGETAVGKHPLAAVRAMAKIAEQAEHDALEADAYNDMHYVIDTSDVTAALCDAACTTANDIRAKAIVTLTTTGKSARRMSKFRPTQPVVAATPLAKTFHQLALSWGVYPVLSLRQETLEDLLVHAVDCAKELDLVSPGDLVVIAAGVPVLTPGNTNLLKVEAVKGNE